MFNQPTWWSVRSPKLRSPKSPKLLVTVVGWLEAALPWNGCSEATRMKIQYAAKGWATLEFHLSQGQNMSYNLPPAVVVDHWIVKECQRNTSNFHVSYFLQDSAYMCLSFRSWRQWEGERLRCTKKRKQWQCSIQQLSQLLGLVARYFHCFLDSTRSEAAGNRWNT